MSKRSHHHHHHHHHHPQQHANNSATSHQNPHNHHNGSPFPPLGIAASGAAGFSSPTQAQSPLLASGSADRAPRGVGGAGGGAQVNGEANEAAHKEGLPAASHKVDTAAAQQCRLQDAYWSDDEEDMECPLCLEEIDLSDANFKPCPCGYQICRFCWHHIKQNLNGRCPACRRKYSDQSIEFKPMSAEEIKRLTQAKKQKEKEKKELENMNRKHLANMRVVQKNLVYVVGLSSKLAKEELIPTLRSNEYFGQYGRISKILISKRTTASKLVMGISESNIGVYVTYHRKEDAARAIVAIDGSKGTDGRILRASYGTTKYCTTYLRNLPCTNPACTYLHEPGEEADSFTKEDLSTLRHAAKDMESKAKNVTSSSGISSATSKSAHPSDHHPALPSTHSTSSIAQTALVDEPSALPKTASWASGGRPALAPVAGGLPHGSFSGGLNESDMPPLSASNTSSQKKVASGATRVSGKATGATKPPASTSKAPPPPRFSGEDEDVEEDTDDASKAAGSAPSKIASIALPGLPKSTTSSNLSPSSPVAPRSSDHSSAGESAPQSAPFAPPGLVRTAASGPPPGLGPSRPSSTLPETTGTTSYQPSASAQAVLDDMRHRRNAAESAGTPHDSPFPDFDYTLSSFNDGDFSFNFPAVTADKANGDGNGGMAFQAGAVPGMQTFPAFGSFNGVIGSGGIFGLELSDMARELNQGDGSPGSASAAYSGPFDPFAGDDTKFSLRAANAVDADGPFRAIEEMQKSLPEESHEPDEDTGAGNDPKTSRFDFAKRDPSSSTASPQVRDTQLSTDLYNDQDPLALSKDVSGILEGVFDEEPGAARLDNGDHLSLHTSGAAYRETNIYGRAAQAQAHAAQQAHASQLPQTQSAQPSAPPRGPPGLSSVPSFSSASTFSQLSGSPNNWYHDLQQQRAQQQQSGGYGGGGFGDHQQQHRSINGGALTSEQTLLAQIMAGGGSSARRSMYSGGQQGSGDLPFFDPAIMSMHRQQQAQAAHQQQQQQQQQQRTGTGSSFSPFDQHSTPHQLTHHTQGGYGGGAQVQVPPGSAGGQQGGGGGGGSGGGGNGGGGTGYRSSPYPTMS